MAKYYFLLAAAIGMAHAYNNDTAWVNIPVNRGGPLYTCGDNGNGQLGISKGIRFTNMPTKVEEGLDGQSIVKISAGLYHSIIVTDKGRTYTFGRNNRGQLGIGLDSKNQTITNSFVPLNITKHFGSYPVYQTPVNVSACNYHTLVLTDYGKIWAWGSNTYGQLGRNVSGVAHYKYYNWTSLIPVDITDQFPRGTVFKQVICKGDSSYALTNDSRVFAWGRNSNGQLGTGDKLQRESPVDVTATLSGVIMSTDGSVAEIVPGLRHTLFRTSIGRVFAVGSNSHGQLCLNSTDTRDRLKPVRVRGAINEMETIDGVYTMDTHTVLRDNQTRLYGCGSNEVGQLGLSNFTNYFHPVQINYKHRNKIGLGHAVKLSLGVNFTLVLTSMNETYAMGSNKYGELCVNRTTSRIGYPVQVSRYLIYDGYVIDISAGYYHSFILSQNEVMDPTKTVIDCFPVVAGLPMKCTIRLFNPRGNQFGLDSEREKFKLVEVREGDGTLKCPPPNDIPTYERKGIFSYTWTSYTSGRGGRFKVSYEGKPLLVGNNNTHNTRYTDMNREMFPGWNQRTPQKSYEYINKLRPLRTPAKPDELYLFVEPTDQYDVQPGPDLVLNSGAELGRATSPEFPLFWTNKTCHWYRRSAAPLADFDEYYFAVQNAGFAPCEIYQNINLTSYSSSITSGLQVMAFNVYYRTLDDGLGNDVGTVIVEYMDASNVVIDSFNSGPLPMTGSWTVLTDSRILPTATVSAKVRLIAQNAGGGTTYVFFDQVTLRASGLRTLSPLQKTALVDFYSSTNGRYWRNKANWLTGDPCLNFWQGVVCRFQLVEKIQLSYNNLTGYLPETFKHLTFLRNLDLHGNTLRSLNGSLSTLYELRDVRLQNNALTAVEESIVQLTCMTNLHLQNNAITNIPTQIGQMFRIQYIDMSFNSINQQLPDLTYMTSLHSLKLEHNKLVGTIPRMMGVHAPNLQLLDLSHNTINSTIPYTIGNLTKLHTLQLTNNLLYGTLPAELKNLPLSKLHFTVNHNILSGVIPEYVKFMRSALLSSNNWTCPVPLFQSIYDVYKLECREFETKCA